MNIDWEQARTPIIVVAGIVIVVFLVWLILSNRKAAREPTPMQLLVRNIRASARRMPAKEVWLTGNAHVPPMRVGRLQGVLYSPHAVALVTKWRWYSWRPEILLASPSDVQDYRGDRTIVSGTGAMRYVNDLFWLQPDLQDERTRIRWARTLGYQAELFRSPHAAEALLEPIAAYYRAAVVAWLAPQEELAALDLNAQVRRAIPFGEREVSFRDENEPDEDKEKPAEEEDAAAPKGASQ